MIATFQRGLSIDDKWYSLLRTVITVKSLPSGRMAKHTSQSWYTIFDQTISTPYMHLTPSLIHNTTTIQGILSVPPFQFRKLYILQTSLHGGRYVIFNQQ